MHRLFVALRPPSAMRAALMAVMGGVENARWQSDDQLHLTLRFIGAVDRPQAEDIAAALAAVDRPRPTIALRGTGIFDHKGHARSLWAGIAADDALKLLRDRIERALARAGISPEHRAFRPHVTIARMGRRAAPADAFLVQWSGLSGPPATVDAFILFESRLGQDGASYEAIARYPLS